MKSKIIHQIDAGTLYRKAGDCLYVGDLKGARTIYRSIAKLLPDDFAVHYDLGLVDKYSLHWKRSLKHSLKAIEIDPKAEGALWNAGIAATALEDWKTARRVWKMCGINLPKGRGDPAGRFGSAVVRLNPKSEAETVWVIRVCPVRAMIVNIPLPESGYRLGDIVLHDGAPQGQRESDGKSYPVFNVLERVHRSLFRTYAVELNAPTPEDIESLASIAANLKFRVEDWSHSIKAICFKCSFGIPHEHKGRKKKKISSLPPEWSMNRQVGIAATNKEDVLKVLYQWTGADHSSGREVISFYAKQCALPATTTTDAWWQRSES